MHGKSARGSARPADAGLSTRREHSGRGAGQRAHDDRFLPMAASHPAHAAGLHPSCHEPGGRMMNGELEPLVHAYLEGSISAPAMQQLNALLLSDAQARREFAELMNLDSAL